MKYLIIAERTDTIFRQHAALLRAIAKRGELVIASSFSGEEDTLRALGCRLLEIPGLEPGVRLVRDLKLIRQYKEILHSEKPDKVITYSAKASLYAGRLCCRLHIPYYANIDSIGEVYSDPALLWLEFLLYKLALKEVRAAFFESADVRAAFVTGGVLYANSTVLLGNTGVDNKAQMTEQSIVILTLLALQHR